MPDFDYTSDRPAADFQWTYVEFLRAVAQASKEGHQVRTLSAWAATGTLSDLATQGLAGDDLHEGRLRIIGIPVTEDAKQPLRTLSIVVGDKARPAARALRLG